MRTQITLSPNLINMILAAFFFGSGCAAMMYQIVWERMLFTSLGVDLLSVTIIVSVFMFGLGLGGVFGGRLADLYYQHLLYYYLGLEIVIAAYGLLSSKIILMGTALLGGNNHLLDMVVAFTLLAPATLLMGATFPILVKYVDKTNNHIGISVGNLYFANTLGAALGAYLVGFVLFYIMGMQAILYHAAGLNLAIAISVWLLFRRRTTL